MLAILHLLGTLVVSLFKSRRRLEVENLFLRHQLNIALRRAPHDRFTAAAALLRTRLTRKDTRAPIAATSPTVFGDYCLSSAVLGGARIRAAHAAVRSESG
jgi:hypothetical protein